VKVVTTYRIVAGKARADGSAIIESMSTLMTGDEPPAPSAAQLERAESLADVPMVDASPTTNFLSGTGQSIRAIWRYRDLLRLLFKRELRVRYKDSVLGFFWTLLRPLAQLAVYAIAVGQFLGASKGHDDYPIYVFAGLTIWQLFSEILSVGTGVLLANSGLIKKIYLPREVFPLAVVASALFNFLMQIVILLLATVIAGRLPHPADIGFAVLAVGIVLVYGTALAFVLGAVNVYLRDVQYIVEIFLIWGLWTAPIVYHWSLVTPHLQGGKSWVRQLYLANPLTEAVLGFQRAFWTNGKAEDTLPNLAQYMLVTFGVGVVVLWLSQRIFARLQSNFAQEM
jgi:ABC-2 type transport system permease protein